MTGDAYDVFVSYRHLEPDKSWVRKTSVPALEQAGLTIFFDYRCFRIGYPLITEMSRSVEQSRCTVAVLTPAYLEGRFADLDNIWAEHLGLEERALR